MAPPSTSEPVRVSEVGWGRLLVPHAVASLEPALMTDYVCRIRDPPLDRAVETLVEYL